MAILKAHFFLILALVFLLHLVQSNPELPDKVVKGPPPGKIDCFSACNGRCRLASRQKICHRACQTCCQRCNCVPPGTSGNRDVCPCYATMTTHGGRLKCP